MKSVQQGIADARKDGIDDLAIAEYLATRPDIGDKVKRAMADPSVSPTDIVNYLAESSAYRSGEQMPTAAKAVASAVQGPTFGFADELAAALAAPVKAYREDISIPEAYRQGRDVYRGMQESFEKQQGFWPTVGVQAAASLPMMAVSAPKSILGKTAQEVAPMSYGGRVARSTGTGMAMGAISGAGTSKSSPTEQEFYTDILKGGGVAGGLSAALTGGSPILAGMTTQQIAPRVSQGSAQNIAGQRIAQALLRGMPESPGLTPLTQAQAKLRALGPEGRIADVSPATTNLLDVMATMPGKTSTAVDQAIRQRQATAAQRMLTGAEEAMGKKASTYAGTFDALALSRQNASRPYYEITDNAVVTVDSELKKLIDRTADAHSKVQSLVRLETGELPNLSAVQVGDKISFQVLDSLKKTVDDFASIAKRADAKNESRLYSSAASSLVEKLKAISPKIGGQSAYAKALESYAGPSKLMDAMEVGRSAFTATVGDLTDEMKRMTAGELEAFRMGAVRSLQEKVGTEGGRTQLLKFWKEPNTADRLKLVFGDDYRSFQKTLLQEGKLKPLESVGRGSQTARRLAGMEDLSMPVVQTAAEGAVAAKTGGMSSGLITKFLQSMTQARVPESVRNEIGQILLSKDPAQFDRLRQIMSQLNTSQRNAVLRSGVLGGQTEKYFKE